MSESRKRCIVLAAGDYYDSADAALSRMLHLESGQSQAHRAMIIAADGGLDHAVSLGLPVDLTIGDFDSVTAAMPKHGPVRRLPAQKDDSDTLAALKIGWSHGLREFHIFGALGGRLDHTIANIQLVAMLAQHGGTGLLYGDDTVATAICDARIEFPACHTGPRRMVSVFSHSDNARDVNERGLQYELRHATLDNTTVRGLSNELVNDTEASIDVHDGTLIVTFPPEVECPSITWFHRNESDLGAVETQTTTALVHHVQERNPS